LQSLQVLTNALHLEKKKMPTSTLRVSRRRRAARRVSASLALGAAAAMSAPAFSASTVYTWSDTAGTDSNWSDAANWTPAGGPPGILSTDTVTFSGNPTTFQTPVLDTNETIGELIFATAAGGWTLNTTSTIGDPSGNTLTLAGTGTTANIGINALAQTSGTTTINANLSVAIANETWEIGSGGTLQINGVISASSNFDILTISNGASGTTILTANNTYGGYVVVNSGTLQLSGNGAIQNMGAGGGSVQAGLTLNGGTFLVDNTATAISNRLNSSASVTFAGGNMVYNGNASTVVTDALGPASILGPAESTVTVSSTNGASLTFSSISRAAGAPVLFVNGNNLGHANGGQIIVSNPPPLSGNNVVSGPNIQIVPFLLGEASSTGGTTTGSPNTFVAYNSTTGALRPLLPGTTDYTTNGIVSGNNTYITAATTASSSTAINSLVINNGDLTVADSQDLSDASGALLFVTNNAIKPVTPNSASTGLFDFSGANEGIVSVKSGVTGTISAQLNGSTAMTVEGPGQLNLTANSSNYSGAIIVPLGVLQFGNGTSGNDGSLASNASVGINAAGAVNIDNVSNTPLAFPITVNNGANLYFVDPGTVTVPVNVSLAGGAQFVNFNNTGSLTVTAATSGSAFDVPVSAVNSFFIFNGGPVNIAGPITSETLNSQYFYDRTSSPITLSNAADSIVYSAKFYMQAINGSGASGLFPNESVTIPAGASFSTALTSTSRTVYITNENNNINTGATAYKNQLPPPATFNLNGSMTTYIVYMGGYSVGGTASIGQTTMNVVGTAASPATLNADLYTSFIAVTMPNTVVSSMIIGPYATETSTPASGFGFKLALGGYGYFDVVGPNAAVTDGTTTQTGSNELWLGTGGDALMEIGGSSIGLPSSGSAVVNVSDGATPVVSFTSGTAGSGFDMANSTAASNVAVLNIFNGGVLNWNPGKTSDTNFVMGFASGQTATINVVGGTLNNNGNNAPIELGAVAGVNASVNLDSDSSGNVGKLMTSYVTAHASNSAAILNFNGGELEYSDVAHAAQGTFIGNIAGGVYIYPKGAIIGTNGSTFVETSGVPSDPVTIGAVLKAPTGSGVSAITVSNGGVGYTAPPLVQIASTDGIGTGATGYATINSFGTVTGVVVTNPGSGYDAAPTITFIDGGAPGAAGASYTFTAAAASSAITANTATGGLTKVDNGILNLSAVNTYGGPTVIETGILELSSSTVGNNIASSSIIDVGDTAADGSGSSVVTYTPSSTAAAPVTVKGAAFYTKNITTTTGFQLGASQILSGFGTVLTNGGSTTNGLTVNGTLSPGITPALGTALGNAAGATTPVTGALTIHTGGAGAGSTIFAAGGKYYWKLNLATGGSGATSNPGTATTSDVTGTNWDALVLDTVAVTATPGSPFTVQAVGFGSPTSVTIGGSNTQSYSWTIARASDASLSANLLANFSLNTSGMPAPATGYGYSLSAQADPSNLSDSDLVVNYAPVPEPTALALLAPAAGAMLLRRRKVKAACPA
jgi:fibronectin-binding autotransporter adhesin